jgi:hypothetical protein
VITKFGKRFLTNFIAGNTSFSNKEIAIGIANNVEYPLSDTNSRLGFEFYRVPARLGGVDIDASVTPTKYTVIYSATIPTNVAGKINEVGLYPGERSSKNYFDSKFITDFELPFDWEPTPEIDQSNFKVGDSSLIFKSNGSSEQEYKLPLGQYDLSGYGPLDTICFSYKVNNALLSQIKVRFYSSETAYYQVVFNNHSLGYNIKEKNISDLTPVNSPDINNITHLGIVVVPTTGEASVSVDGLRINDEDTFDPTYGLIARSILPAEITKSSGRESQIEFKLDLSFGD